MHTLAAAFGLATLLAASAEAFTAVKLLGAAYLLYVAWGMLKAGLRPAAGPAPEVAGSFWRVVRQGFSPTRSTPKWRCSSWRCCRSSLTRVRRTRQAPSSSWGPGSSCRGFAFAGAGGPAAALAPSRPAGVGGARPESGRRGRLRLPGRPSRHEPRVMSKVLIIGASRGLGLEFVRQYREAGAQVTATARDDAGLARLQQLGAKALRLDIADAAGSTALAWQIDGEAFDIVVINAGVGCKGQLAPDAPSAEDFDHVMHTNVLGPMRVLPQVVDALAPGRASSSCRPVRARWA